MHSLELKVPPLVVLVVVAATLWLVAKAVPQADFQLPARPAVALILATVGVGTAVAGVVSFRRAKTTVNPLKPDAASSLVTSGIYRLTRNPMYLGMLILLAGWAALWSNTFGFLVVPSFVLYMNRFQILPEERALTTLFASEFATYCARVRRWL
ncbi:MAG: isoprenylcysteine carboxylmethyltransferase family protein [Opitutaceae bacterium]